MSEVANMTTLHAIADDVLAALEAGEDGELTADAEARLDALQLDLSAKLDAVCRYIEANAAEVQTRKNAAKRLTELAQQGEARDARLRRYVLDCLQKIGCQRYSTDLYRLSDCKTSNPSVKIDADADIPAAFAKTTVELDRAKVLEAWKAGWDLPAGVHVVQGRHLRIK